MIRDNVERLGEQVAGRSAVAHGGRDDRCHHRACATPAAGDPGMTPALALGDIAAITRRNLLHIVRTPQLLAFASLQPVIFVLLFH